MLADAALAAVLFASTNVDDLFILVALLADPRQRATQVVLGQYLGIAALVAASLAAALVALVLPPQYIGLLGLVPVGMGIHGLLELRGQRVQTGSAAPAEPGRSALAVAAVTIANGGDNIGVYTPVFAVGTAAQVAVMAAVFALMTAMWLALARWLVTHPALGAPIRSSSRALTPLVLVAVGLLVLHEAGSFALML